MNLNKRYIILTLIIILSIFYLFSYSSLQGENDIIIKNSSNIKEEKIVTKKENDVKIIYNKTTKEIEKNKNIQDKEENKTETSNPITEPDFTNKTNWLFYYDNEYINIDGKKIERKKLDDDFITMTENAIVGKYEVYYKNELNNGDIVLNFAVVLEDGKIVSLEDLEDEDDTIETKDFIITIDGIIKK